MADPEVSFDGTKILFSMRKNRDFRWNIWEMNVDGSDLVRLTDDAMYDAMDPAYITKDKIAFTSTRTQIVDEYNRNTSPLLHVGERDPNNL